MVGGEFFRPEHHFRRLHHLFRSMIGKMAAAFFSPIFQNRRHEITNNEIKIKKTLYSAETRSIQFVLPCAISTKPIDYYKSTLRQLMQLHKNINMAKLKIEFIFFVVSLLLNGCSHFVMASNLNDIGPGMTKSEVITFLGQPQETQTGDGYEDLTYMFNASLDDFRMAKR